eukprot:GHVU01096774.1.p1 GENE.GHVU01096774.1~~GHVU01096774.1.p1  ORF type:complete len:367 (+),score=34.29 GHVU01096774.1:311-1411(+)
MTTLRRCRTRKWGGRTHCCCPAAILIVMATTTLVDSALACSHALSNFSSLLLLYGGMATAEEGPFAPGFAHVPGSERTLNQRQLGNSLRSTGTGSVGQVSQEQRPPSSDHNRGGAAAAVAGTRLNFPPPIQELEFEGLQSIQAEFITGGRRSLESLDETSSTDWREGSSDARGDEVDVKGGLSMNVALGSEGKLQVSRRITGSDYCSESDGSSNSSLHARYSVHIPRSTTCANKGVAYYTVSGAARNAQVHPQRLRPSTTVVDEAGVTVQAVEGALPSASTSEVNDGTPCGSLFATNDGNAHPADRSSMSMNRDRKTRRLEVYDDGTVAVKDFAARHIVGVFLVALACTVAVTVGVGGEWVSAASP